MKYKSPANYNHYHKMSQTMSSQLKQEILDKYNKIQEDKKVCYNCCADAKEKHSRIIFWKNYSFCSAYCRWDSEYDIRKSWQSQNRQNAN